MQTIYKSDYFFISRDYMKHIKYLLFLILTPLFILAAFADEHAVVIEGNITLTSDYVFRGFLKLMRIQLFKVVLM